MTTPAVLPNGDHQVPFPYQLEILPLADVAASDVLDSNSWYTPPAWIAAAVQTFGEPIDLDPASCALANTVVGAQRFYTRADNGLLQPWASPAVWCNPPYAKGAIDAFVDKAIREYRAGRARQVLLLTNNCTSEGWFIRLAKSAAMLYSTGRIRFWRPDRTVYNPEQGQAIAYLGPHEDRFTQAFAGLAYAPRVPAIVLRPAATPKKEDRP